MPGLTCAHWQGLLAPLGKPQAIIGKLREHALKALAAPGICFRAADCSGLSDRRQHASGIRAELSSDTEIARWKTGVKSAGIKPIEQ